MNPEYVQCDECQCWNLKHWVFDEEAKAGRKHNELFGICQRRAPAQAGESHKAWSMLYLHIFKFMIPTGIAMYRQRTTLLPTKRYDEGCWEGIRKDTVEKCDIV